ncbi:hypothetical protein ACQ4PT_018358 [Festuca glaucescens]
MDFAVNTALWVVGKALAPVTDGLLESWAASAGLGPNVDALKMQLLCAQGMLDSAQGKDIHSDALKEHLNKLCELAYWTDDVLDELDYFRIQDALDGTYHAANMDGQGYIGGLVLNARHTGRTAANKLKPSRLSDASHGDPNGQEDGGKQGCLSVVRSCGGRVFRMEVDGGCTPKVVSCARNTAHTIGKHFPSYSFPSVQEDDAESDMLETSNMAGSGRRFLCGTWPSKAPLRNLAVQTQTMKFYQVEISTRMVEIVEQLKPLCAMVSTILSLQLLGSSHIPTQDIAMDRPKTTPNIIEPELYGRNDLKKNIVDDITHEDYEFGSKELVHFWIGLDIVHSRDQGKRTEDVALSYVNELVNHGFFKKNEKENGPHYVIHDLLHDLAVKVVMSSYDCLSICSFNMRYIQIPASVRHMSIIVDNTDVMDISSFEDYKSFLSALGHRAANCPSWLGGYLTVENLKSLSLRDVSWNKLPPLGDIWFVDDLDVECQGPVSILSFQCLKRLELVKIPRLTKWVGYGKCHLFSLLEVVIIQDCPELVELPFSHPSCRHERKDENMTWFPKLRVLEIIGCPKLASLPPIPWTQAPFSAEIKRAGSGFEKLVYSEDCKSELTLEIEGEGGLHSMFWNGLAFHNLADLRELNMENCPPLPLIHLQKLKFLKTLNIRSMSTVLLFEGESHSVGCPLPVEHIQIDRCDANGEELTQLLSHFPKLTHLMVIWCGKITGLGVLEHQTTAAAAIPELMPSSYANKFAYAQAGHHQQPTREEKRTK